MTAQPEKLDLNSLNISAEKRQQLLELFPEARTENGKIDFERLKLALGETVEVGKERYGMNWPGKADCYKAIQTPSQGTLLPCPAESVNFDSTENLIIEGDNLEVLKLLQKSYLGKVKMIYIDPPYNTGNDFVYPDDFSDSLRNYQEYTGQVDAEGKKFGTNSDSDGRFHSRWMNMMYPRLYLARNLLKDDGIFMISIDDHEITNLRRLCDEIFGEESFLITLVWQRRQMADSRNQDRASTDHEYIICYRMANAKLKGNPINKNKYSNPDNDPRGPWFSADLTGIANNKERPNLHYDLVNPDTNVIYPPSPTRGWSCSQTTMQKYIAEKRIIWPPQPTGRPRFKKFLADVIREETGFSSWLEIAQTTEGTRAIQDLFRDKVFPFSKPVDLIKELINQGTDEKEGVILDFFAGSGTTAQAVLDLNKEDGGNRKFILVQLPEPTGREDYPTIVEITKERVRRVIKKLNDSESGQLPLEAPQDRGFRVFKLDASNFKPWDANAPQNAQSLARQLELHIDHVLPGRSQPDIFYEILLKSGFALTTPLETLTLAGKQVFSIAGSKLLVCLEPELTLEVIRAMAALKPERVVCLDASFTGNDQLKANAVQIFRTQGDPSFKTV